MPPMEIADLLRRDKSTITRHVVKRVEPKRDGRPRALSSAEVDSLVDFFRQDDPEGRPAVRSDLGHAEEGVPNIAAVRSVRRDVETGLQTGVETVVNYIQTVQTIKLRILIKYTLSRNLYGLYVIHSSLYPGLYPGLYPVSTSETIGASQQRMFSRRSSKPRHFARRSGSRTWRSSWIGAAVVSSTTWSSRRPSSAWACLLASERQWALRRGRLSPANRFFHPE